MPTFEFVIQGPAVSIRAKDKNARRYQRWIMAVRTAALAEWGAEGLIHSHHGTVELVNYYTEVPPDVDNIIKPVLDALESVVYEDDECVYRVVSEKHSLVQGVAVPGPSPIVADALGKWSEVLVVRVHW